MKFLLLYILLTSPLVLSKDKIDIAVGEWPPFITNELSNNGFIAHLIRDIFIDLNYEVSINFFPWARVYEQTAYGLQDLTGVWMHKKEREKDFLYSDPVLKEQFVFFHLKENKFHWNVLDDMRGLTIGGLIKSSYGPKLDLKIKTGEIKIFRLSTHKQAFEMLLKKRVDVVALEKSVGQYIIINNFIYEDAQKITHHKKEFLNNMSYVLFPKRLEKSKDLLIKFNKVLNEYRKSGKYDKYFKDYGLNKYWLKKKK